MGTFKSEEFFQGPVANVTPIAEELMQHFRNQAYEVESSLSGSQHCIVSLAKGNSFKAILGMKTALNVEITGTDQGVRAVASVGIFGQQAIPAMIMLFFAWPVLLTQIWGMCEQANLDDEVISVVEASHKRYASAQHAAPAAVAPAAAPAPAVGAAPAPALGIFCSNCGTKLNPSANFCGGCGTKAG